mmetsp:Transcript_51649/g.109819  ORF Transcript_51649/g.109819 Transcript_51649/m.109819 type:complete len:526 (+) Transcript_51649:8-1585(+)
MRFSNPSSLLVGAVLLVVAVRTGAQSLRRARAELPSEKDTPGLGEDAAPEQFDAVIVGAGWAGISAAKTLLDSGVSSVLVLEANDYIGGRSKTINSDGRINVPNITIDSNNVPVECGSEWLYLDNGMEKHLRENDYLEHVDLNTSEDDWLGGTLKRTQLYVQLRGNNDTIRTIKVDRETMNKLHDRTWRYFSSFRDKEREKKDQSYFSAIEKYKKALKLTNNVAIQYLNLLLSIGEVDIAAESNKISLDEHRIFRGWSYPVHYMSVPGAGYGNVAAALAAPFAPPSSSTIKLGAKVTEINREDPNNSIISFTKNGVSKKVSTKTVLVTVSLGVLKAGSISFKPKLPRWKQQVIDKMGFGVMNKCILQWNDTDTAVWPDSTWFALTTPDDHTSGKWTTFFNPSKFKGVPTLVGWISGDDAKSMEKQTDEEVLGDVMENLRTMFPTLSQPDRVIVTRWGQEETVRGTYSYKTVGRDHGNDSRILKRRVQKLWFAGEATAGSYWYATTVGGWKTGHEAALEMVQELSH